MESQQEKAQLVDNQNNAIHEIAVMKQQPKAAWNPAGLAVVLGNRRKRASIKVQPVTPSPAIVADYTRDLLKLVNEINGATEKFLFPVLEKFEGVFRGVETIFVVEDSTGRVGIQVRDDAFGFSVESAFNSINGQLGNLDRLAGRIATQRLNQANTAHRRNFINAFKRDAGINISNVLSPATVLTGRTIDGTAATVQQAIQNNIDLIKTIPKQHLDKVRAALTKGLQSGSDAHSIRQAILKINDGDKYRARLIARDQMQKLNSVLEQARQQEIGITGYVWRTVEDESVRETHIANNGQFFRWDSPPPETGHPGEDINCRCTAEPDLSFLSGSITPEPVARARVPVLTPAVPRAFASVKPAPAPARPAPVRPAPTPTAETPISSAANLKIAKDENKIKLRKTETGVLYDRDGKEIFRQKGKKAEVQFSRSQVAQMKGNVLTHNHPSGSPLSPEDFRLYLEHGLHELRATGRYHTYRLSGVSKVDSLVLKKEIEKASTEAKAISNVYYKPLEREYDVTRNRLSAEFNSAWREAGKLDAVERDLARTRALVKYKHETGKLTDEINKTIIPKANEIYREAVFEKQMEITKKHGLKYERVVANASK